ncbi:MAG: TadE/TadG family type IV pilus assembly protein [Telluria sp.]
MWAPDLARGTLRRPSTSQRGTAAIEFAIIALVFFTLVFGVIEVARLLYIYNTLQEVTRRAVAAAVNVYPNDAANIARIKQYSVFRDSPGELILAAPITDQYIRFSYLNNSLSVIPASAWPSSAAKNREVCMKNPNADTCIRFVQAQVCEPDTTDSCKAPTSPTFIPLINLSPTLHKATTISTVESLGYTSGTLPCPCT